jgi:hypothetical protein
VASETSASESKTALPAELTKRDARSKRDIEMRKS